MTLPSVLFAKNKRSKLIRHRATWSNYIYLRKIEWHNDWENKLEDQYILGVITWLQMSNYLDFKHKTSTTDIIKWMIWIVFNYELFMNPTKENDYMRHRCTTWTGRMLWTTSPVASQLYTHRAAFHQSACVVFNFVIVTVHEQLLSNARYFYGYRELLLAFYVQLIARIAFIS